MFWLIGKELQSRKVVGLNIESDVVFLLGTVLARYIILLVLVNLK